MDLIGNLVVLADQWAGAHRAAGQDRVSRKTLGARALDDAKLFDRLEGGGALSIPRFEKLIDFLAEPGNWPDGKLPVDVCYRLAFMGVEVPGFPVVIEREVVERVGREAVEREVLAGRPA